MINYHKEFLALLSMGAGEVPIYYEMFKDKVATPCISYYETDNTALADGDTLRYSNIVYQVKIWAEDIATLQDIAVNIDEVLTAAYFERTYSIETNDEGLLVKILRYKATGYED